MFVSIRRFMITIHLFIQSVTNDWLTAQVYDSLFLLFSRRSYKLLSSDLHNSLFLTR